MRPARHRRAASLALALATPVAASLAVLTLGVSPAEAAPTPSCTDASVCTVTFGATGSLQTWTVPTGVSSVQATVDGAAGGSGTLDGFPTARAAAVASRSARSR